MLRTLLCVGGSTAVAIVPRILGATARDAPVCDVTGNNKQTARPADQARPLQRSPSAFRDEFVYSVVLRQSITRETDGQTTRTIL